MKYNTNSNLKLTHGWGSKNECLTILDFHNVQDITTMVYYCVLTIKLLGKKI